MSTRYCLQCDTTVEDGEFDNELFVCKKCVELNKKWDEIERSEKNAT